MRSLIFCAFALAILSLVWNPVRLEAGTLSASPSTQDDLAARVKSLEERVDKLESEKTALDLTVVAHQKLLKDVFAWMSSLPAATESLAKGMETARSLGFEAAGANPLAKAEVLDAVKRFAQALDSSNPASGTKPKNKD